MDNKGKLGPKKAVAGGRNTLQSLRLCCGHPYSTQEAEGLDLDAGLVDASAKLTLLAMMLPKLIERGHRILIFSAFVLVLEQIERYLQMQKIRFVRLDGTTSNVDRELVMRQFNAKDSRIPVFLLSTRAGGVGVNLQTADTCVAWALTDVADAHSVIMHDADHNPQADLQAIARAHRFGQTKPVTCYKLVIRGTCEEKMVAVAKRKLALEHIIIGRLNADKDGDEGDTSLADFVRFGAEALLKAGGTDEKADDLRYSASDIDKLIDTAEIEAAKPRSKDKAAGLSTFANVWTMPEGMGELGEGEQQSVEEQRDFWAARLRADNERKKEALAAEELKRGRGQRQRKQLVRSYDPLELTHAARSRQSAGRRGSCQSEEGGQDQAQDTVRRRRLCSCR